MISAKNRTLIEVASLMLKEVVPSQPIVLEETLISLSKLRGIPTIDLSSIGSIQTSMKPTISRRKRSREAGSVTSPDENILEPRTVGAIIAMTLRSTTEFATIEPPSTRRRIHPRSTNNVGVRTDAHGLGKASYGLCRKKATAIGCRFSPTS